jgi:hypothetical protein
LFNFVSVKLCMFSYFIWKMSKFQIILNYVHYFMVHFLLFMLHFCFHIIYIIPSLSVVKDFWKCEYCTKQWMKISNIVSNFHELKKVPWLWFKSSRIHYVYFIFNCHPWIGSHRIQNFVIKSYAKVKSFQVINYESMVENISKIWWTKIKFKTEKFWHKPKKIYLKFIVHSIEFMISWIENLKNFTVIKVSKGLQYFLNWLVNMCVQKYFFITKFNAI